jgi:glutamate formiminotransferase / 5-formyltetrahydrofolate cyclo-ligase
VPLLAVPNVSEGRDHDAIAAIADAFGPGVVDVHSDPDHNRSVYTIVGEPGALAEAVLDGARAAMERIDLGDHSGVHPHVGAVDVAPIVHPDPEARGAASAEALVLGDLIGRHLQIPVLLYGTLAQGRTRAELRRGGPNELARRIATGELVPDFGPHKAHPSAGATLVAARPPLVAFNLLVDTDLQTARTIAASIREGGPDGIPGLRALGIEVANGVQLSFNVEAPMPLRDLIAAVQVHARVREAELVGLAPQAAFTDFPGDVPIPGFDPRRHIIERVLETQVS